MALSHYEQQRQQNIARNQELLAKLGLLNGASGGSPLKKAKLVKATNELPSETRASTRLRNRPLPPPQPAAAVVPSKARKLTVLPTRRSSRARTSLRTTYREDSSGDENEDEEDEEEERENDGGKSSGVSSDASSPSASFKLASQPVGGPGNSSKNLHARVYELHAEHLGRHIPKIGNQAKFAVMKAAAPAGISPVFNRMSGIQEWQNCIMLFVNVGGSDYKNIFGPDGTTMSWFAQATQNLNTHVVQRLVVHGARAAGPSGGSKVQVPSSLPLAELERSMHPGELHSILLFCRLPDEPYVYLGRLALVSVSDKRLPIQFVWTLLDHPALARSAPFQEILAGAKQT